MKEQIKSLLSTINEYNQALTILSAIPSVLSLRKRMHEVISSDLGCSCKAIINCEDRDAWILVRVFNHRKNEYSFKPAQYALSSSIVGQLEELYDLYLIHHHLPEIKRLLREKYARDVRDILVGYATDQWTWISGDKKHLNQLKILESTNLVDFQYLDHNRGSYLMEAISYYLTGDEELDTIQLDNLIID